MKDIDINWHKNGINEISFIKRFGTFFKILFIICFFTIITVIFSIPILLYLLLAPSIIIVQIIYFSVIRFNKKRYKLLSFLIILILTLTIVASVFCWIKNSSFTHDFSSVENSIISLYLIELKFLPIFIFLYFGIDIGVFLLTKKIRKWYKFKKENYIFVSRYIEILIYIFFLLSSFSLLKLIKTNSKQNVALQLIWEKENILLTKNVALNKKRLNQHTLLIGATGSGKTTTALSIINQLVYKLDQTVIIIDGKGDIDLIDKVKTIDENAFIWKINGEKQYNPFASKNYVILADKIMSLFDFSEPHYQNMAHDYLLILLKILFKKEIIITLANIIKYFAIKDLKELIDKDNNDYDYVLGFEQNKINGLLSRLNVYNEQSQDSIGINNDLSTLTKNHKIILFSLNSLDYPQLASNMGNLLIQDLKEFASIKQRSQIINVVLDELNVFLNESLINLINKTRSFNYQLFLCFQTLKDLETKDKDLTDVIFGNTANIIAHGVKDPNTAEYLAKVFGTTKTLKITKQLNFQERTSDMGSVRESEEFIFHPNDFKNLQTGVANVKIINQSVTNPNFDSLRIAIKDYSKNYDE